MNGVCVRIFSSRKVWIALAGVAGCVVVVLGLDPAKWTPLITAIVTLSTVTIGAAGYEDGKEKGAGNGNTSPTSSGNDVPAPSGTPSLNSLALLLLCLAPLFASTGCTPMSGQPVDVTPKQAVAAMRERYTSAVRVLISARQLGKIDDETAKQIHDARHAVMDAMDLADAAASSNAPNTSDLIAQAKQRLDELIQWRIRVEGAAGEKLNSKKKGGADGNGTSGTPGRVRTGEFAFGYRCSRACRAA